MLAHIGVSEAEALEHVRRVRVQSSVHLSSRKLDAYLTRVVTQQREHLRQMTWLQEMETQSRAERERFERAYRRTSWWSRLLHSLACIPHDEFDDQVRLLLSPPPAVARANV